MLIEGGLDPYGAGTITELFNAMKKNKQKVKLIHYEKEGHNIDNKNILIDMWTKISSFVRECKKMNAGMYFYKYKKYKAKYNELKNVEQITAK